VNARRDEERAHASSQLIEAKLRAAGEGDDREGERVHRGQAAGGRRIDDAERVRSRNDARQQISGEVRQAQHREELREERAGQQ